MPAVPSPLTAMAPVKNFTINTDYDYPVDPDATLPDVPTLVSLAIPTLDTINTIPFTEVFPSSNSLVVPSLTFTFNEVAYSSSLLNSVKAELLTRMAGGTGLSPIVEQGIWDRGRDREQRASLQAERTLLTERSSVGFSRPTGAQASALNQIVQETQSKMMELSREIMIKQAELEQENIKTSIQQTIALEDILIRNNNNVNQRAFEVAKYIQDTLVELFKVSVSKYNSEVAAYQAFTVAYKTKVEVELNKLDIYKAKIEAEKLKGDINEQSIKIYLAQIEGVKSNVEIYKVLISTISEKLKAEELKLETFKTDIQAYSALVGAKASEYSIYSEQIKGELAKTEVYDSSVKAFASKIQSYAATSDVTIKSAELQNKTNELNIKKYEADIDSFIKQAQADQLTYQAAVDLYKGESSLYLADVSVNRALAELELKQADNTIQQNKYKGDISINNAQISLAALQAAYQSRLEGKKAAGSIYQAIGSSALSAINVSAQVQGSASIQGSESHNYSNS